MKRTKCNNLIQVQGAYIAGIVDGEGCLRIDKGKTGKNGVRRTKYSVTIGVANTCFRLVKYLKAITGVGSILPIPRRGNRKPQIRWMVYSQQAEDFLKQIRPWLLVKNRQADLLLACRDLNRQAIRDKSGKANKYKEKIFLQVKGLNKRGII